MARFFKTLSILIFCLSFFTSYATTLKQLSIEDQHFLGIKQLNIINDKYKTKTKQDKNYNESFKYKQAVSWFKLASDRGYKPSQYAIGMMYYLGLGVIKDYAIALKYLNQTSSQPEYFNSYRSILSILQDLLFTQTNVSSAQYELGMMYYLGIGMVKDYAIALDFFKKAAKQQHVESQTRLGIMYFKAQGLSLDLDRASYWLQKSVKSGDEQARYYMQQIRIKRSKNSCLSLFKTKPVTF